MLWIGPMTASMDGACTVHERGTVICVGVLHSPATQRNQRQRSENFLVGLSSSLYSSLAIPMLVLVQSMFLPSLV